MTSAATKETGGSKESRVGKRPVPVPKNVTVNLSGRTLSLKGPKGELAYEIHEAVEVQPKEGQVVVSPRAGTGKRGVQFQGLTRALLQNAVYGVTEGYKASLDLYGVGYRAEVKGSQLNLSLGLSHSVAYPLPEAVKAKVETIDEAGTKRPRLHLESHDKALLGQVAARIRSFRPPEPYKGKGVRHTGERIREKAGKTGGKA